MSASPQKSTKSGPSRYAHLVRLAQVLAAFFIFAGLAGCREDEGVDGKVRMPRP
jgi:hypothetical protein